MEVSSSIHKDKFYMIPHWSKKIKSKLCFDKMGLMKMLVKTVSHYPTSSKYDSL